MQSNEPRDAKIELLYVESQVSNFAPHFKNRIDGLSRASLEGELTRVVCTDWEFSLLLSFEPRWEPTFLRINPNHGAKTRPCPESGDYPFDPGVDRSSLSEHALWT
jgi:hypothetical protein